MGGTVVLRHFTESFHAEILFQFPSITFLSTVHVFLLRSLRVSPKHSIKLSNDSGNNSAFRNKRYSSVILPITPCFWEIDFPFLLHIFIGQYIKSHTGSRCFLHHLTKTQISNKVCSSAKNFI